MKSLTKKYELYESLTYIYEKFVENIKSLTQNYEKYEIFDIIIKNMKSLL